MNLALLYVRVSSKEQEREGFSLDAQEKLGFDYALRKNLKIKKSWKVSESAWKQERVAFNQMIEYAKRHDEIEHIIFDVPDRMTRNDFDKMKVYTLIKEHNKTIHFSRTNKVFNKDSGSDDEFMFDIEVAVAKKMSNDISKKASMGMLEKAEQGLFPSYAPIGYKNNLATHLIEVNEEEALFVKRAFSLMATGSYSLSMLVDELHKEGFKTRRGRKLHKATLAKLLKNPIYYGAFTWKGKLYQGSHTPLISKELFDKVQEVFNRSNYPYKPKKNLFAFTNLVYCGVCNCKVIGERKKDKYNYYHCTFSKGRHNGSGYIKEEALIEKFGESIKEITIDEKIAGWMKEALRESDKNTLALQENRLKSLRNEYDRVNNRLSRLYDAKFDGDIEESVFKAKESEYKAQMIEIKSAMNSAKVINLNFYEDGCRILELSKRLYPLYLEANYEEKAKLLRLVASNFSLTDLNLCSTYRKPFDILAKGSSGLLWRGRRDSNSRPPA